MITTITHDQATWPISGKRFVGFIDFGRGIEPHICHLSYDAWGFPVCLMVDEHEAYDWFKDAIGVKWFYVDELLGLVNGTHMIVAL